MLSVLRRIWNIVYRINSKTNSEWQVIKSQSDSIGWHLKRIVVPITIGIALSTFIGYLFAFGFYKYSFVYVCLKTIAAFCESFFTFYVSFLIIFELSPKIGLISGRESLFKLLAYSFTTFWIASFIAGLCANYKNLEEFLKFLGLFGVYLFWTGSEILLKISERKKYLFILSSVSIVVVVYLLIHWAFGYILTISHFPELFTNM